MSLIVLAGPAGVGKGSIVRWILENRNDFTVSVSATTRDPRPGEVDGVHYHFVTNDQFENLIAEGRMLEWAKVHGANYYGTMRAELERAEAEDKHLLLEIDLQGARQVAKLMPNAIQIFIHPPSFEELERRLRSRATETESQIQTRLETARMELASAGEFQYQVINENLEQCALEILSLVRSHEGQK